MKKTGTEGRKRRRDSKPGEGPTGGVERGDIEREREREREGSPWGRGKGNLCKAIASLAKAGGEG